jgi:alpha-L-fucosidase
MMAAMEKLMNRMDWWRDCKLGLFIHWGPYTRLHGRWNGKPLGWCAEWARHSARIPDADYRRLAADWNPSQADTGAWADLASMAGMG